MHENTVIADLLARHLALQPGAATKYHTLREYGEAGLPALTVLMRKERTPVGGCAVFRGPAPPNACQRRPPALAPISQTSTQ